MSDQSPQQLFAGETLSSGYGKLTFSSTAAPLPFKCNIQNSGSGVVLPGKRGPGGPVIFEVSSGVFACWATDGSRRLTGTKFASRTEQVIAGKTRLVVKGDPVFGMVKTPTGGWKIQVHQGAVLVGSVNGKRLLSVGESQQVRTASNGSPGKVKNYLVPDTHIKAAFLAVQPALCETPILSADATGSHPEGLAKDGAGNIWFTDDGATPGIGEYHANGTTTEYTGANNSLLQGTGLLPGTLPRFITTPDKNGDIWFTDDGATPAIGMIDPATNPATIDEYTIPAAPAGGTCPPLGEATGNGSCPWNPVVGPDGNIWFTNRDTTSPAGGITNGAIGMYDPATKEWSEFSANLNPGSDPEGIAVDRAGTLWFTDDNGPMPAIGRITPTGTITEFSNGLVKGHLPRGITAGLDGTIWFADEKPGGGLIGMINPKTAATTGSIEFDILGNGGLSGSLPEGLAADHKGNIWFTDQAGPPGAIGLINPMTGGIVEKTFKDKNATPIGILVTSKDELWYLDQAAGAAKVGTISPSSKPCPTP